MSSSMATVTRLSAAHTSTAKYGNSRRNASNRHRRLPRPPPSIYRVKLADESDDALNCDSDHSSLYDSVNEVETASAKDESDLSDGYMTNGSDRAASEFEVDKLSDSEDLESDDTASGTDDDVQSPLFANVSSTSDTEPNDLEMFAQDADMEESDGPIDQEFGRADFSVCLKCKRAKENSLYRYCKKCHQIRRTHFPPRPTRRRKRSSLVRHDSSHYGLNSPTTAWSLSKQNANRDRKAAVDDDDGRLSRISSCAGTNHMQHQSSLLQKHHSHEHSAGESSCCSSQEMSLDGQSSFSLPTTSVTSQSTFGSDDIDSIFNRINHSSQRSNSYLFDRSNPNSPETVYANSATTSRDSSFVRDADSGIISKMNSSASTVSAFTVSSLSQSFSESSSQGKLVETKSSIICDSSVATTTNTFADTAGPSTAYIKRTSSHTVTSTEMPTKRKLDAPNADDADAAEPMAKRTKFSKEVAVAADDADESPSNGMCMVCITEPKNGAFVHSRYLHVCCCYHCAVKIWNKRKRCPICNFPVKTVLKIFVH